MMDANQIMLGSVLLALGVLIPGYAVSYAIIPKRESVSTVERAGLSMVFGFVPAFMAYFNAKNLGIPITAFTAPLTIAATILVSAGVWLYRRQKQ